MTGKIPISRAGRVVAYSPRRHRPWRWWWLIVLPPFIYALIKAL